MTIKLLATYQQYSPRMIVTLDSALEAFFVAQGNATYDLTGGIPYVPPVVPNQVVPASLSVKSDGTIERIVGPKGDFLVVSSAAPSNADGRPDGTIYIQTA